MWNGMRNGMRNGIASGSVAEWNKKVLVSYTQIILSYYLM